jgi:hypothetical protein
MGGIYSEGTEHFNQMIAKRVCPHLGSQADRTTQRGNGCGHIGRGATRLLLEMNPIRQALATIGTNHVDQRLTNT